MRRQTLPLMGYLFFAYSALTVLVSYLPVYFQNEGWSQSQIGWLIAIGPLAAVFAQPFWGYMSDKWKTIKKILIICLSSGAVVSVFFFQITEFYALFIFGFMLFIFVAPTTALGDSLTQKTAMQQGLSFGRIRMWGSLGFAFTSLVSGFFLERVGVSYLYIPFLLFTLLALSMAWLVTDAKPANKPVTIVHALQFGVKPRVLFFLGMIFFISVGHRANDSFLGLFIVELGGAESLIGMAWFVGVVSEAVVFFLSYLWFRRFHPLFFILIAGLLYAFRWFMMAGMDDPSHVLWLQVLHGITFGGMYFSALQYISKLVPEELQATGHLLFITTFFGLSGVIGC